MRVEASFRVADFVPCQRYAKLIGFEVVKIAMAGVGRIKSVCKDEFRVAGAVQEAYPSDMLRGQGPNFL